MSRNYHQEEISFRFVDFPEQLLRDLEGRLPGVQLKTKDFKSRGEGLVVAFELREDRKYDAVLAFIREKKIPRNRFGVWISLVTERDSDGIHVPEYVLRIIHDFEGQIDFSFTTV